MPIVREKVISSQSAYSVRRFSFQKIPCACKSLDICPDDKI